MRAFVGLCLASIIALAGCTSIPLTTALSLSSMSPRSLAQLDPAQVLVRISLPVGFELNVPATRLDLQLKAPGTSKTAAMDLIAVTVSRSVRPGGLLSPDVPVLTYLLRLTPGKPAASGTAAFYPCHRSEAVRIFRTYALCYRARLGARGNLLGRP